jgi:integrase/recombinase XerD
MIELEPDERNRVLLSVLYAAGLRVSEACGLRWRNLQARGNAGQILIHGKGGRTRAVFLPPGVWGQLAPLKGTAGLDAPVLASRSGKLLERSRVTRIVREASQRAGIAANVSTHWLRHAHASHALDRGAPIHLVQATLGHRSVATTSRYLHARPGESSAAYVAV